MNNEPKEFSVKNLLDSDNYLIPIYQRNYAWKFEDMHQLLRDVADYLVDNKDCNYYIGNLIVYPKKDSRDYSKTIYETVDGQQRLTTLNIIMCALRNTIGLDWYKGVNIRFDNRDISNITLSAIYDGNVSNNGDYNQDILNVYHKVYQSLESICKESSIEISDFLDYFLNKVIILRITVPEDTDLNHYFEIMNSRGEQLEQHEVLKANLMDVIKGSPEEMYVFDKIWECCSNLDKYVQMNFNTDERANLFGDDWTALPNQDFAVIQKSIISCRKSADAEVKSLNDLFADNKNHVSFIEPNSTTGRDNETPDRFHSLINFPNLLLHVLSITNPNEDVPLDDKRLSKTFDYILKKQNNKISFVKNYISNLLYIRTIFDTFILKTKIEDSDEKWSLKKLKAYDNRGSKKPQYDSLFSNDSENNQVTLLLSMFHVSSPTMNYKYWMNACLNFVYANKATVTASKYIFFLESLSKTYLLDRFLVDCKQKKREYSDFIHNPNCTPNNSTSDINWNLLNNGVGVENFILNCYDYILWLQDKSKFSNFYYSYRNSVEHFYPQHPIGNFTPMEDNHLNNFGNLCILNRGINSKFSNSIPKAKVDNFGSAQERATYSIKLQLMMARVDEVHKWDIYDVEDFFNKAKELIQKYLEKTDN